MLSKLCPEAQKRVTRTVLSCMATLDVDIKIRPRKGTHLVKTFPQSKTDQRVALNNIVQKIESRDQYSMKMQLRNQDEKEIKVELMMKLFLDYIEEKIDISNREGSNSIKMFSEFLMGLCVDKILPVQSNFIQYIPFYVILRAKARYQQGKTPKKTSCVEQLFMTSFIS